MKQTAARGVIGMGVGAGARLTTAARGRVGMPSSMGRPITGAVEGDGGKRPMTAIKGVGFSSTGRGTVWILD